MRAAEKAKRPKVTPAAALGVLRRKVADLAGSGDLVIDGYAVTEFSPVAQPDSPAPAEGAAYNQPCKDQAGVYGCGDRALGDGRRERLVCAEAGVACDGTDGNGCTCHSPTEMATGPTPCTEQADCDSYGVSGGSPDVYCGDLTDPTSGQCMCDGAVAMTAPCRPEHAVRNCDATAITPMGGQAIVFGCVQHEVTQCGYSANDHPDDFRGALAAFADCRASSSASWPCAVMLKEASGLNMQTSCPGGSSDGDGIGLGFHTVIPFTVVCDGVYHFRFHTDYGRGGYIGVNDPGGTHHAEDIWGHVEVPHNTAARGL
jgi:hypothetical protein